MAASSPWPRCRGTVHRAMVACVVCLLTICTSEDLPEEGAGHRAARRTAELSKPRGLGFKEDCPEEDPSCGVPRIGTALAPVVEEPGNLSEEVLEGQELMLAISLMGFVVFIMTLFYLVNWDDEDMRIYVWTVISVTISIFIAVFTFTSVQSLLQTVFLSEGSLENYTPQRTMLAFTQLCMYFIGMQIAVAFVSGGIETKPFKDDESMEAQKEQREIRFKSLATLFAHMAAFAAINFGGCLQHQAPFDACAFTRFLVAPLMLCGQLVVGRAVRLVRIRFIRNIKAHHGYFQVGGKEACQDLGIDWCLKKWDDETYESENEIAGMCLSFLLVNAARFSITGVMPDTIGIEEQDYRHSVGCCVALVFVGVLFGAGCVCSVIMDNKMGPREEMVPGTFWSTVKRMVLIGRSCCSVALAWCFLFAAKWHITLALEAFPPNGVISRVLLALQVSAVTFLVILLLDKIADHRATGPLVDEAIISIINALALLVGFSWEQSFDGAVETLAEQCFSKNPVLAELILAATVCIIVYPAWRKYILRKLLALITSRDQKNNPGSSNVWAINNEAANLQVYRV